jgi:transposase-like protein
MRREKRGWKAAVRYSEAFKMEVVRELESQGLTCAQMGRKYGIKGCGTVQRWVRQYGNGSRGKVIRVERPQEIDERGRLKERVERLERALADAHVELILERQYTQLACERAGIKDVGEFKKKADGRRRIKR